MSDQEQVRENIYFQETEASGGFESGPVNCLAQLRLNNFPTASASPTFPRGHHRTTTNHRLHQCSTCGSPMSKRSSSSLQHPTTLHGFTRLPLPITSPVEWGLDSQRSLRRCISDPINSPGTEKTNPLGSQSSDSCMALSPENAKTTPSPTKASSSASAILPPLAPALRPSVSDPSSSEYQVKTTPLESNKRGNPDSERMKRMKDRMREMSQWWDQVLREGEENDDNDSSEDDKNCALKAETEAETESEEAVSVERSGNCLIIHIKCPCGKGYQVVLSGTNCYYKLM